jgi:UDPglucose--hexose-1-phosphate uridylyltransferase
VVKKDKHQRNYYQKNNCSLLEDYLKQELHKKERVLFQNDAFVVLVPFWAIWPFETMIIPKQSQKSIVRISDSDKTDFAEAISVITKAYDKLFACSFPYSNGIHQAPTNGRNNEHWHWHMSFYPPLLRSPTVKKFMVGYEMFGSPQRDITPETAAEQLRQFA